MNRLAYMFITLFVIAIASCETNTIDDTGNIIAGIDYPITETGDDYYITYKYPNFRNTII